MPLSRSRERLLARLQSRRQREREGLVLVEGPHAIEVALAAGARFRFALGSEAFVESAPGRGLSDALRAAGVEVIELTDAALSRLADTETPQGILAVVEEPEHRLGALVATPGSGERIGAATPILVLDRIQDPGNVGTLIRSAAAFGAPGVVVLDGTVDPWNPKVVRATVGEAFRLPVVRAPWEAFDTWRREEGVELLLADAGGEDVRDVLDQRSPAALDRRSVAALLVGNEGAGPRPEARQASGTILALPLASGVESLNAGVAGSILLWALGPGASRPPAPPNHPDPPTRRPAAT